MASAPDYSVEALIANSKRRCLVPSSQLTFTDPNITLIANDELQGEVVPLIMSTREEYFVDFVDVPCPSTRIIAIPDYVIGAKLRSVCYVQQTSPLTLINLPRLDLDVVAGVGFANYATLAGFYVQGNDLYLYPNTSVPVGTVIRLYYYKRTLVLANPEQYGRVVSVDTMGSSVQLDFVPTDWVATDAVNTVSGASPFEVTNETTITGVSSPSVLLTDVTGISVGDYLSLEGFSGVPQVPVEAHGYLAQLTAAKLLEALGDRPGMEAALAKAASLKKSLLVMISQRVDGSVKKIVNASGGLRINNGLWRRGWGRF